MMTKIGNIQKIMISLDIFAEEKSFLNWPENLPLKYQALVSGHPVYILLALEYIFHTFFRRKFHNFLLLKHSNLSTSFFIFFFQTSLTEKQQIFLI